MLLLEWRTSKGISQVALAERLGVTQGYVSDLERGAKTPSGRLAAQIERETGGAVRASSWFDDETVDRRTRDTVHNSNPAAVA